MVHGSYYVSLFVFGRSDQELVIHALRAVWASNVVNESLQSISAVRPPRAEVRGLSHSPPCADLESHQAQAVFYSERSKNKVERRFDNTYFEVRGAARRIGRRQRNNEDQIKRRVRERCERVGWS